MSVALLRRRGVITGTNEEAQFAVGSFTKTAGALEKQSITGLGFKPSAIVFWTSGSNEASGTWDFDIRQAIGFTSGPSESYSVAGASRDGVTTAASARRISAHAITIQPYSGSTDTDNAALDSFDNDGFTLDWVANGGSGASDAEIMFLAFGGVDAKVVAWQSPTVAGNYAVDGVPFQPDLVLHAASLMTDLPSSAQSMSISLGAMDGDGNQWTNCVTNDSGETTTVTKRYQRNDKTIASVLWSTGSVIEEAEFVSMNADGFTTNFTTAAGTAYWNISLCIKGLRAKVGAFTSNWQDTPVTGVGLEPACVLMASVGTTGNRTTVDGHAFWTLGGTSVAGSGEGRVTSQFDLTGQSTTNADPRWDGPGQTYSAGGFQDGSTFYGAYVKTFDEDGFTAFWGTNHSGRDMQYLALAAAE